MSYPSFNSQNMNIFYSVSVSLNNLQKMNLGSITSAEHQRFGPATNASLKLGRVGTD